MDDSSFWKIIESAKAKSGGDTLSLADEVHQQLIELPPDEISVFDAIMKQKMIVSYTWLMWEAASLINGGCSDDGFEYFRSWLIGQGREVFEAALANPDTLIDVVDPENDNHENEDLFGVGFRAYKQVVGDGPPGWVGYPTKPPGECPDFDDEEAMAIRLPRLSALYRG